MGRLISGLGGEVDCQSGTSWSGLRCGANGVKLGHAWPDAMSSRLKSCLTLRPSGEIVYLSDTSLALTGLIPLCTRSTLGLVSCLEDWDATCHVVYQLAGTGISWDVGLTG